MKTAGRAILIMAVLLACVGCDQATKNIARQSLAGSEPISFLGEMFCLQYVENPGAFLSLGAGMPETSRYWLFIIFVGCLLAGMLAFLLRSRRISRIESAALSLILGGGAGNLIDRVFNEGRVIDFMSLGVGSLRTGVFNVADIAISVGSVWFLALAFKTWKRDLRW